MRVIIQNRLSRDIHKLAILPEGLPLSSHLPSIRSTHQWLPLPARYSFPALVVSFPVRLVRSHSYVRPIISYISTVWTTPITRSVIQYYLSDPGSQALQLEFLDGRGEDSAARSRYG
jgi:hypothetical protein